MVANDDIPAALIFVLAVSPETGTRRWSASLLRHVPGKAAEQLEFDNPLALARFLAQMTMRTPPREGLR
jgi:hypothetical protein